MTVPTQPKIYHIMHVDRLPSIVQGKGLWCDAEMVKHPGLGTTIGMNTIKSRRLNELTLNSHPGLHVGDCVPFYFCPRSIMLYLIHRSNHPELLYHDGQDLIVHLEVDLHAAVTWAEANGRRWAFTLSNAGPYFFEDRCDLSRLNEIDWKAVQARNWQSCKDAKQAEFLVASSFPWGLIERIGVRTNPIYHQVAHTLTASSHKPRLEIKADWYY